MLKPILELLVKSMHFIKDSKSRTEYGVLDPRMKVQLRIRAAQPKGALEVLEAKEGLINVAPLGVKFSFPASGKSM